MVIILIENIIFIVQRSVVLQKIPYHKKKGLEINDYWTEVVNEEWDEMFDFRYESNLEKIKESIHFFSDNSHHNCHESIHFYRILLFFVLNYYFEKMEEHRSLLNIQFGLFILLLPDFQSQ